MEARPQIGPENLPSVTDLVDAAGTLPQDASLEAVEAYLKTLAESLVDASDGRRALCIEAVKGKLKEVDSVGAPAALVEAFLSRRSDNTAGTEVQGEALLFQDPALWDNPVVGAHLLDLLVHLLLRFVVLPLWAAEAIALWIVHTFALDAFQITPILCLTSPVKGCGKTTLLDLIAALVLRPLATVNITAAALFRTVERYSPTLLIDEADAFLKQRNELRGILNSGHRRNTAFVIRTVGDDFEPRCFRTWGAKVIAQIGKPAETLVDRSILIELQRKAPGEQVEKLRLDRLEGLAQVSRMCARWVQDNLDALRATDPALPEGLRDREADNWFPLFAIADAVGGDWPQRARAAALELSGREGDTSAAVQLLADIRQIFTTKVEGRIRTKDLLAALNAMDERPWAEWRHGKPLSAVQLARLLKPFDIRPRDFWFQLIGSKGSTAKGYAVADFEDAVVRYLPPIDAQGPQDGQ